ncbi:MAG TPA: helix-turn-helix transcriptional regulator [Desulfitobacterium dehalogenans]|uniref:Helix-turn-helix transcriptional regulator n=1 Tax=Desulfitobacterium dehalogenans TaxID=36854 RepID=A0A7C7D7P0_9FIRM|nr:helix-turn-helix transcriptional regulator [Desulfitobacterium dehalogenans]
MNTSVDFAHCLKYLLSALGVSINRLSKALNVDGSLVNRWVNGKRIPSYNSNYIETITQFLSANIKNSLQIQLINELFERVFGVDAGTDCNEEKIKKVLFEAQGISLSNHKKHTKESKKLLKYKKTMANPPFFNEVVSMSHEDKIIAGTHNVASAFRHLLGLTLQTHKRKKVIYITYFNDVFFYMSGEEDLRHFQTMLLDLMTQGCEVHYLLRITHDVQRMMDLLDFLKPLIGTNQLYLYYLKSYDSLTLGKDYFIVPETGVLSCFFTQADKSCALYLRNPLAISFYEEYWVGLTQSSATPLLIKYPAENEESFHSAYMESEEAIGNRFLYKDGFSLFTLPLPLYKKLLLKRKVSKQEMASALDFHQKCLKAFQANIEIYEYKDIYTIDNLSYLVKNRQFFLYDHIGLSAVDLEMEELIDFLQNMITLLKTYDNYSIAFVRKNAIIPGFEKNVSCLLKERHAVIVEILGSQNIAPMRFSIHEPMMVNAVEGYFKILWQQIAPVMKKKAEVIAWLQQETDSLKSALYLKSDS